MKAYGWARLTGRKVAIEYDKTKEYKPFCAEVLKNFRAAIKLPGDRGIIGIRRESIGHSNKTQTMMFSSEFEYTASPTEIAGEKYYKAEKGMLLTGFVEDGRFIEAPKDHPKSETWIRSLDRDTIVPEEYIKYQTINADPLLTEHYAQHKEQALREKVNNPIAAMIAQNGWFIIALIIVGAIAFNWMNNNNQAASFQGQLQECKNQIIDLFNKGVCVAKPGLNYNITGVASGTVVK